MEMWEQILTLWAVSLALAICAYVYSQQGGDPRLARAFTWALTAGNIGFGAGFITAVAVSAAFMQLRMHHPLFLFDHATIGRIVYRMLDVAGLLPVAGLCIGALFAGVHSYVRHYK